MSIGSATDKNIVIPPSYNGVSVTQIAENGFKGTTDLESVVLPEGITVIGKSAFSGCTTLEINIPESVRTSNPYALNKVKTINVLGTNSWSGSGASWNEYFGSYLIDYGSKSFSARVLSASSYSETQEIAATRGGDYAIIDPWTATWTR